MKPFYTAVYSVVYLLLVNVSLTAQAPNFNWNKKAGGTLRDQGDALAVDKAGNIYVTGEYFSSNIDFGDGVNLNIGAVSSGNCDFFLTKYDPDGTPIWAVRGGGILTDRGYGVVLDNSGDLLVTGHYFGTATFDSVTRTSSGNLDMFVAKYDTSGKLKWFNEAKSVSQVSSRSIASDNAGNAYVAGYFGSSTASTVNIGSLILTTAGQRDMFLVKFDPSGEPVWAVSAGGVKSDEEVRDVAVDEAGNVYAVGFFVDTASFSGTIVNGKGGRDVFVAKYSPLGQLIWVKSGGGIKADDANSIALDGSGNLYIAGKIDSAAAFESTELITAGGTDAFIAKYDTSGNLIWILTSGGDASDNCLDLAADPSGNIYAAGGFSSTASFGTNLLISNGNEDLYIMKVDPSKNILWVLQGGGPDLDRFGGLVLDAGQNIITTGYFSNWIKLGNDSLSSSGAQEVFISKIGNNPVPVELISFKGEYSNNKVTLSWTTASELNNSGFEIERKSYNDVFKKIGFVNGHGTSTEKQIYSFSDDIVSPAVYTYRLKQINFDGTFAYSNIIEVNAKLPGDFILNQNFPNPFNPSTTISFNLPLDSKVKISVFNSLGELITDIVDQEFTAGKHEIRFDALNLASGIYLYKIKALKLDGSFWSDSKKMLILK